MTQKESREPFFSTLKFPYLPMPAAAAASMTSSPDHHYSSGMATPPLHTLASVPFKWEEQPGKPRPCTDIIVRPEPPTAICLELPPYMQQQQQQPTDRIPKMPSPTTVLDGPYNLLGRSKFSSFRFFRDSFDSGSPQTAVDASSLGKKKTTRFFGRSFRVLKRGKNEVDGVSFGISHTAAGCDSSVERVKMERKMRRNGSFSSFSEAASTHLWVTVCKSLKQAMAWTSSTRKSKKEGTQCFI